MKMTVRSGRAMGSSLRLTLPGVDEEGADAAWSCVSDVFARVEAELTRFDAASPLTRLNQAAGSWVVASPLLARALGAAWRAYRMSCGRFDPRVIGALETAGERAGVPLPPSPRRLSEGERWLSLDARRGAASVTVPIDLGGIGKGLALRWAVSALRRDGCDRFLIGAGGDVVAAGTGPADRPWVVAIEDPTGEQERLAAVELVDAAVATSSIAVRSWTDATGHLRHHLIDPATLEPAEPVWIAATVVDRDPAWAEVRSKAAFLAGRSIAAATRGVRAWWVAPDGRLHASVPAT